ncbi:NnrU family protein [Paracoccus ravus]|uniref:NnrU family protein n=1 Tax=Paracoccus ravus TaxID=2447760 RepID=UPI00106E2B6F|nr:NnrU family protein [Paracoccus ravus]
MDWAEFALALAFFLGSHVIPARFREPLSARFGRRTYLIGYSLLSLALLYWLVIAAGRAPFVEIWPQLGWMRWLVNIVMPIAILLACTLGMAGVMGGASLWASAHLLANGDLAHAILFGLLLLYALFGITIGLRRGVSIHLGWRRIAAALLIWAAFFHLHPLVIGVSPLP